MVAKFGPTGENLFLQTWASTYRDVGLGISVDPGDQPWITGSTCGTAFRLRTVVHTANGCSVTGYTKSANFPTTVDGYQTVRASAGSHAWQNPSTGELVTGLLDSQANVTSTQKLPVQCGQSNGCSQSWKVIGTLDINHDGVGDILLYNASGGDTEAWRFDNSGTFTGVQNVSRLCGTSDGCSKEWQPVGVGDFNHDGIDDILCHSNLSGELQAWLLDGSDGVPGTLTLSKKCAVNDGCWATWRIMSI